MLKRTGNRPSRLLALLMFAMLTAGFGHAAHAKQFHPGFYVEGMWNSVNGLLSTSRWMWEDPSITGVYLPVTWAAFENREGQYNFEPIDRLLAELEKHNKFLVLQIYHHGNNKVPDYLIEKGGVVKSPEWGGDTPKLWEPWVMDKLIAALKALGNRYDGHPLFEGAMISEFPTGAESLYSCMTYTEQWVRKIREVSQHYKNAVYFAQITWGCGEGSIPLLKQAMADYGVGVSTTDLVRSRPTRADEIGKELRGVIPYFAQGDTTYLNQEMIKNATIHDRERYNWGVESGVTHFGVQTMWFARRDKTPYSSSEYKEDIMNVLPRRHTEFGVSVNNACPDAISPCDSSVPRGTGDGSTDGQTSTGDTQTTTAGGTRTRDGTRTRRRSR